MREGAATHRLVEYRHQEHVTVFEIGLHFIDGLDPESETENRPVDKAAAAQVIIQFL